MGGRFVLGITILSLLPSTLRANEHDPRVLLRTSDLRSAYLMRAGVVSYGVTDRSPQGLERQLKRHFDVVIGLLLASAPRSIETALARLEKAGDHSWSKAERSDWRDKLMAMRYVQLRRLAAYRDRGVFPLNEGQSIQPVPIFVDDHDTACAVGQLMQWSGRGDEVSSINKANNFVYVLGVSNGSVNEWILDSGLTIEEAALIQPAYGWAFVRPGVPDDAVKPLETDWSRVVGDLRFSNVKLLNGADNGNTPPVNASVYHNLCSGFFCSIDFEGDYERVLIQFDVETTSPLLHFVRPAIATTLLVPQNQSIYYSRNDVSLFLSEDLTDLFFHHAEPELGGWPNNGNPISFIDVSDPDFEATTRMTVVTEMLVSDGHPLEVQRLQFYVAEVPEPFSCGLLFCGCAAMFCRLRGAMGRRESVRPRNCVFGAPETCHQRFVLRPDDVPFEHLKTPLGRVSPNSFRHSRRREVLGESARWHTKMYCRAPTWPPERDV